MGNEQSGKKDAGSSGSNDLKYHTALDQLATKYILTQNFQDMKRLSTKAYCDKLIILTSDVIKKFLNDKEIAYLSHKITDGVAEDKMEKQKVVYLDTSEIQNQKRKPKNVAQKYMYDPKLRTYMPDIVHPKKKSVLSTLDVSDPMTKDRMCKGIAKFYIKIAHLYGAILKTINPLYVYKDKFGKVHTFSIMNKEKIPPNADVKLTEINFCTRRINALQFTTEGEDIKINISRTCALNRKEKNYSFSSDPDEPSLWGSQEESTRQLGEDIGIPELEQLYYDEYDYVKGKFTGMSSKNKSQYDSDLKTFYVHFTGKKNYNEWNKDKKKKFSNIPLADFHSSPLCKNKDSPWHQTYIGKNEGLFKDYAENLKKMMRIAEANQKAVIGILDNIFEWVKKDDTTVITLKSDLTEKKLDDIVTEVRKRILELYYTCEKDFKDALQIFEAIIKERYLKTSIARSKDLEKKMDILVTNEIPSDIKQSIETKFENLGTKAARVGGGKKRSRKRRK